MQILKLTLIASLGLALAGRDAAAAATTFDFNGNGIFGVPTASITAGDFTVNLAAGGPPGSLLYESFGATELGIGPGGEILSFEVINGVAEQLQFSFDEPGVLTGIDFDGVKDEALEFFILQSSPGVRVNFFDSAANTTIPGAIDNAVTQGAVIGDVVYLLETSQHDDEALDLAIPFAAGQQFTLTYAEVGDLGAPFSPTVAPNGARLQRITVAAIPEPASLPLLALAMLALIATRAVSRSGRGAGAQ